MSIVERRGRQAVRFALLLAFSAGAVDAIVALLVFGLFAAHMSGNVASGSTELVEGHWAAMAERLLLLPLFVGGLFLGGILTEVGNRRGDRRTLAFVLCIEALFLLAFIAYRSTLPAGEALEGAPAWKIVLLLTPAVLAMGMQNLTVRHADGRAIATTYITGALTNAAEEGVILLFWLRDRTRGRGRVRQRRAMVIARRQPSWTRFSLFGGIAILYILGAMAGAAAEQRWQTASLVLPAVCLAALAIWDLVGLRNKASPVPTLPLPGQRH